MLTEAQIAVAEEENKKYQIICKIIDSLPEEQWIDEIVKLMPDVPLWAVHDMISIHLNIA